VVLFTPASTARPWLAAAGEDFKGGLAFRELRFEYIVLGKGAQRLAITLSPITSQIDKGGTAAETDARGSHYGCSTGGSGAITRDRRIVSRGRMATRPCIPVGRAQAGATAGRRGSGKIAPGA